MRIEDISVREVVQGKEKTIEIEVKTKKGITNAIAPLYKNSIYKPRCLSPVEAVTKFLEIKRHFINKTFDDIAEVDNFLKTIDISADFRYIGGNLAFAISSAMLKAFAKWEDMKICEYLSKRKPEIPQPLVIVDNVNTEFKEFLLYSNKEKIFTKNIEKLLDVHKKISGLGKNIHDVLKTLSKFTTKYELEIGINVGATKLWNEKKYVYNTGEKMNSQEQLIFIQDMLNTYPIGYIEDPFHDEDFVTFSVLTRRLPTRTVTGGDLYANNFERLKYGIELKATSGVNLKPNEMGTISEFIKFVREAKKNKISITICANGSDNLIAHLSAGLQCDYIKLAFDEVSINQINELIRIEEKL